jgi:hypothetical protein
MKTKIKYSEVFSETGIPFQIAAYWIQTGKLDTKMHHGERVLLKNGKYLRFVQVYRALVDAGVFR